MAEAAPADGRGAVAGDERRVVAAVALGASLAPLNTTMLVVALPRILSDFDAPLSSGGWLITGYLIAVAALQTPAGKLGDRLGHRPLFLGGLATFLLASLAAAAAPTLPLLVALRVLQGVAVAAVFPNGWALLRTTVPAARRAGRFGMVGAVLALGVAVGPPLSGVAVDAAGWRAVFLVNLLVALPALVAGRRIAGRSTPPPAEPYDLAGALGWGVLLVGTAALLNVATRTGGGLALLAGGPALAAAGTLLVRRELRHPDPVLQPRFFARPAFSAANGAVAFGNLAWYVTLLTVPLVLERRPGVSAATAGLVLTSPALALMLLTPVGGRLADRLGRRRPAVAGMCLFALGLVPLAVAGAGIGLPLLVVTLTVTGAGFALATPAIQAAALEAVAAADSGAASGVYATSRYLGSILGSTLLAAFSDPTGRATFHMIVAGGVAGALSTAWLPGRGPAVGAADDVAATPAAPG